MALRVWLPLNGNIENKGLSDACKGEGTLTYRDGKIGKALYMETASTANGIYAPKQEKQVYTVALWFKAPGYTGTRRDLCNEGRDYNTYGWRVGLSANENTLTITAASSGGNYTQSFTPDTWYHIAFCRDENKTAYYYINGVLVSTKTGTGDLNYSESNGFINIGRFCCNPTSNSKLYPYQGYINDFRYYDECLSQKQIKEIAKGLCAHYKLEGVGAISNLRRNANYGTYNNFASSGSTCTVVKTGETYNGANVWRMTYTPNDTSLSHVQTTLHGHGVTTPGQTYLANTKYCFWTLCKPISHPDTIIGGTASNIGGWTEIPMKEYGGGWYIVGQKRTGDVTEDKTDTIFTSFKTPSATSGTPIIIDFCCPHLVEGYDEILSEFDYIGTLVTQETDCSGNGHHLTVNGTQTYNPDSARYSGSTKMGGTNTDYLRGPILDFLKSPFTFNCWIYQTSATSTSSGNTGNTLQFVMGQGRDCGYAGFSLCSANGYARLYLGTATSNTYYTINDSTVNLLNRWHMLTGTFDGTTAKLYVDGVLKGSKVSAIEPVWTEAQGFTIGKMSYGHTNTTAYFPFVGSISDARIYCTALSAEDILKLYEISGIIDNKGNTYSYEFIEED